MSGIADPIGSDGAGSDDGHLGIEFGPAESGGVVVSDPIERSRFLLSTPDPVDLRDADPGTFRFPADAAVRLRTDRLTLETVVSACVRDDAGDLLARTEHFAEESFDDGTYDVELFAPISFAGSWLAVAGLAGIGLVAVQSLGLPGPAGPVAAPTRSGARRLLRRPAFVRAMAAAAVAYAAMNLLMTATPVAVTDCHLPFATAAFVIQWHVFAMHAPSFFTGELIRRWGVRAVMLLGSGLMIASAGVGLAGVAVANFAGALVLLGVGWNFLFVGATALLIRSYDDGERAEAQGLNDTVLFAAIALSSLGAGWLYAAVGWAAMNALTLLPLGAVALWLLLAGRESDAAGSHGSAVKQLGYPGAGG